MVIIIYHWLHWIRITEVGWMRNVALLLTIQGHCFHSIIHCLQLSHCFVGDQGRVARVPQHGNGSNMNLVVQHINTYTRPDRKFWGDESEAVLSFPNIPTPKWMSEIWFQISCPTSTQNGIQHLWDWDELDSDELSVGRVRHVGWIIAFCLLHGEKLNWPHQFRMMPRKGRGSSYPAGSQPWYRSRAGEC